MMDQIKRVLALLKSNLLIVISAAVLIIAVVGLFVGNALGKDVLAKAGKPDQKIRSYKALAREPVQLPPENPGEPPIVSSIVPTEAASEALKLFYERMGGQVNLISELSIQHNRFGITEHPRYAVRDDGHVPMTEGLFPEPASHDKPYTAKVDYKDAFRRMLGPYTPKARYPVLDAGLPPDMEQIQAELDKIRKEFLGGSDRTDADQLTPSDRRELETKLRKRLMNLLTQHAYGMHIYVAPEQGLNVTRPDAVLHVFDVGAWASDGGSPSIWQLWLGQMGLWIQADIVEAIARVNRVDDRSYHVMKAPVKRLIKIEVNEGFVGVDHNGALAEGTGRKRGPTFRMTRASMGGMGTMGGMGAMGGMGTMGGMGGGAMGADSMGEAAKPNPIRGFWVAHTGRQSNPLFDVWHAKVTLVVDSQRLSELFNALARVNFMTVLRMSIIDDVDEYEALRQGFVYGRDDVVEVELVIETVWLRQWTTEIMPNVIKSHLRILMPGDPDYTVPDNKDMGTSGRYRFPAMGR